MAEQPVGQQLAEVPISEMVVAWATGIAEAQLEMDLTAVQIAAMLTGIYNHNGELEDTTVDFAGQRVSLMELGFTPTFYQFVDTTIEVKVSVSMRQTTSEEWSKSVTDRTEKSSRNFWGTRRTKKIHVETVNTRMSSRFQYTAEASSLIRTKLVPAPPPPLLENRIQEVLAQREAVD